MKKYVGKMGFPHLPRPPEPPLQLWLQEVFSQKLPAGRLFLRKYTKYYEKWGKTLRGQQFPSI